MCHTVDLNLNISWCHYGNFIAIKRLPGIFSFEPKKNTSKSTFYTKMSPSALVFPYTQPAFVSPFCWQPQHWTNPHQHCSAPRMWISSIACQLGVGRRYSKSERAESGFSRKKTKPIKKDVLQLVQVRVNLPAGRPRTSDDAPGQWKTLFQRRWMVFLRMTPQAVL